jgi:hypothetical protein
MPGIADPAPFCIPDRRNQMAAFPGNAVAGLLAFAKLSPPKVCVMLTLVPAICK